MVLNKITSDPHLRHLDVRIYNVLAGSRRGSSVTIGERRIAKLAHADRRNIRPAIARLVKAGYVIEEPSAGNGKRSRYQLTAEVFGVQANCTSGSKKKKTASAAAKPNRAAPLACPECRTLCKRLPKAGICRSCATQRKMERTAERAAWRVVRKAMAKTA